MAEHRNINMFERLFETMEKMKSRPAVRPRNMILRGVVNIEKVSALFREVAKIYRSEDNTSIWIRSEKKFRYQQQLLKYRKQK